MIKPYKPHKAVIYITPTKGMIIPLLDTEIKEHPYYHNNTSYEYSMIIAIDGVFHIDVSYKYYSSYSILK